MKILGKMVHKKAQTKNLDCPNLCFISVETQGLCGIFVYEFVFFPPQTLGGHLLYDCYGENVQCKICLMDISCVHGQSRLFPFIKAETSTVSTCSIMALLNRTPKIHLPLST